MASIKIPIESALASGATNLWKHTYDDQWINWWKKKELILWKLKFHSTENIECHCMQVVLNWIPKFKFLNWNRIHLKGNEIQIAAKKY